MGSKIIFNKNSLKLHRERAYKNLDDYNFLIKHSTASIKEKLSEINYQKDYILDIGSRDAEFFQFLQQQAKELSLVDIAANNLDLTAKAQKFILDEDLSSLPKNKFNLITSILYLHYINDLPGFLSQIKNCLNEKGLFVASFFGGDTLKDFKESCLKADMENAQAVPRITPFIEIKTMGMILQKLGFFMPVIDSEMVEVTYDEPMKLIRDLHHMGESNILAQAKKSFTSKEQLARIAKKYQSLFADKQGKITAKFEIINITAFKN